MADEHEAPQVGVHKASGYLPITKAAYEKTKADGFYEKNPVPETPLKELTNKEPTENSRGLRFGNMVQMRDVWALPRPGEEELDADGQGELWSSSQGHFVVRALTISGAIGTGPRKSSVSRATR